MTEAIVVDSSILVAHFWSHDDHHLRAEPYISALERGDNVFHLPTLAVVEIGAVLGRKASYAAALAARLRLEEWAASGKVVLYDLDSARAKDCANAAMTYKLRGADAVFVGLAEELEVSIITFDYKTLARRYPNAVVPA